MTGLSRRAALLGAIAAGVAMSFPARALTTVALPSRPMLLLRRIERGLSGGATIVVERGWSVSFARQGSGIAITGKQSLVKVEAPDALADLARIESARSTDAMFPLLLSESGMIVTAGPSVLDSDIALAVREAERVINARKITAYAKAEQMRALATLQQSAGKLLERLPSDLFFPVSPPIHKVQPVSLNDGLTGEFEIFYAAQSVAGAAWLERAERRVITRIGISERQSREVWTLSAA